MSEITFTLGAEGQSVAPEVARVMKVYESLYDRVETMQQQFAQRTQRRKASDLPDAPLTPEYLKSLERGASLKQELARQSYAAGRGGMAGSMGFLAFSQAVEDAQYGIRGVLNNIPQMVLGLGGGMGLVGAISLVSVAAVAAWPHIKKLYGADEVWEKATKGFDEIIAKGYAEISNARTQRTLAAEIAAFTAAEAHSARQRIAIQDQMLERLEQELALRGAARSAADESTSARRRLREAQGADTTAAPADRLQTEIGRLQEDAETQREISRRAAAEAAVIRDEASNMDADRAARVASYEEQIAQAQKELVNANARISYFKEMFLNGEKGKETGEAKFQLGAAGKIKREMEAAIARMKAERDALKEAESSSASPSVISRIQQLEEKANSTYQEAEAIKKLIEEKRKLLEIEKQIIEENRRLEEGRQEVEDATLALSQAEQDAEDAASEQDQIKDMAAKRAALAEEMAALRMEASGQKEKAEAMRAELRLREEAQKLAADGVMSEQAALAMLREKARLEREIARGKQPGGRPGSNIRRSDRDEIFQRFGGSRLEGRGGFLRDSVLDARGASRVARENAGRQESQAKYWEQQLDLQERLVKKFEKLGVV